MSDAAKLRTFPVSNQKQKDAVAVWRHDSHPRVLYRNPDDTFYYEVAGICGSYEDGKRCLKVFWDHNPNDKTLAAKPAKVVVAASRPGPETGAVPKRVTPQREDPKLERAVNPCVPTKRRSDIAPAVHAPVVPNRLLPSAYFTRLALPPRDTRVQHFTVDLTGYVEVCGALFEYARQRDGDFFVRIGPTIHELSLYLVQCLWIKMGKFHPSSPEWTGAFERILQSSGLDGIYIPTVLADYLENLGDCNTSVAEYKLFMPDSCYPVVGGDTTTTGIDLARDNLPDDMFSETESDAVKAKVLNPRPIHVAPGTLGEFNILTHSAYRSLPVPWAAWMACNGQAAMLPVAQVSPDVKSEVTAHGVIVAPGFDRVADVSFDEPQLCLNYKQFAKCANIFKENRGLFKTVRVVDLNRNGSLASLVLIEKGETEQLRCAVNTPEPSLTRGAAYRYRLRRVRGEGIFSLPVVVNFEPGQALVRHSWQTTAEDLLFMRRLFGGPAEMSFSSPLIAGTIVRIPATDFILRSLISRL